MIEIKTHHIPIQGTVIFAGMHNGKERISGSETDTITPIDLFEVDGFVKNNELFAYSIQVLSLDLDNETAECEVTADTVLHNWLEGRLAGNYFQDLKDADDKYKLKRNDLL